MWPFVVQVHVVPKKVREFVLWSQAAERTNRQKGNKHPVSVQSTLKHRLDVANGVYAYLLHLPHRQVQPIGWTRRYPTLSYRLLEHRSESFDLCVTVAGSDAGQLGLDILRGDIRQWHVEKVGDRTATVEDLAGVFRAPVSSGGFVRIESLRKSMRLRPALAIGQK